MDKRAYKDSIYTSIAFVTKAFGHGNRLEILDLLANGEKTVEQVAALTAISVANASRHLQLLKQARLVKCRRAGHHLYYTLQGTRTFAAWQALRDLALDSEPALQLEMQRYRRTAGDPECLTLDQLPTLDRPYLVDVRPADEFAAGSLPGAVSIPMEALRQCLDSLPQDRTIVTYCRGIFCTFADEAVRLLRAHGYQAVRLTEGYPDHRLRTERTGGGAPFPSPGADIAVP
ncbi:MAG: hypothetical protein RLY31_1391 [Bacteroidota bacterium]|jgi:rhodanese-related sulfurtransferase/DNA-binding transcriptional ArsR family regulator